MHNEREIRLLIADDDQDDFELFQEALEELVLPASVQHCRDGVELMGVLKLSRPTELPDIIFLDLNMPQKTGYECIREIKGDTSLKDIPVVIFSTSFQPEIVQQLCQYGADRYLVKPNSFKDLVKAIRRVFSLAAETKLHCNSVDDFVLQP
ncbi:response regulator [Chitinophaga pendula]|uniref:response regulator n=1 Tax=Chitinophaga TaxID=79328 RepID=UPI000BAF6C9A|nr:MULTISPECIES: response regulator [Chitinophaga]ASZ13656.1 response regulator [Chitinophaga sp. MD30]UCJ08719.1 response regulator [Chitinophaga pendula]